MSLCSYIFAGTNAAVTFYGSERPNGDYVTCEVPDFCDEYVSAALGMFYFPSEIVPESNDLQFEDQLVCGDLASVTAESVCHGLGGQSTCVPTHPAETPEEYIAKKDAHAVSKRSLTRLAKRAKATCNEYTFRCTNQNQSTTGWCASGYAKEVHSVQGYTADIWCTKRCTDDEGKACKDQEGLKAKQKCEQNGASEDCATALLLFRGSAIKMPEEACVARNLAYFFELYCQDKSPACLAYENGACTLNVGQYDAFQRQFEENAQLQLEGHSHGGSVDD